MEPEVPAVHGISIRIPRWMAILAVVGWLGVLIFGLAYAALLQWMGDARCEATAGSSNYGTHEWSVLPPGPTCTYTRELNGFERVDGPTLVMSAWIVCLALGAAVCLALIRRFRQA